MKRELLLLSFFATIFTSFAQEEQENIKKEDVVVEFSFNPTLSNVFKLKTSVNESENFPKKQISYQINSKGVPSDFVPLVKKATYINIDKPKPTNYRNYIYGAAGLYGNGEFELLLQPKRKSIRDYEYGLSLTSYNTQNGIDNNKVDNGQWDVNLGMFLAKQERKYDWKAKLDFQHNLIHWYGLDNSVSQANYQNQDVAQGYKNIKLSGEVNYKEAIIKNIKPSIQFFFDNYSSTEIDANFSTALNKFYLADLIDAKLDVQYLNGSFNQSYANINNIDYSFINVGFTPSYNYVANNFKIKAALNLMLNVNQEELTTNFLLLPNLQADVVLLDEIMSLHGGVRSEFNQNSYATLAAKNPFVSPTLPIEATYAPMDFFLGLDGALSKNIKYGAEAGYKIIKDQALYYHNSAVVNIDEPYKMGNSFGVVYDNLNVIYAKAHIETVITQHVKAGGNITFKDFNPDTEQKAWNMTSLALETYANFQKNKWFGQLGINVVDGRYDLINNNAKKLDGFLDMNLKAGYQINHRLHVHANLYNLLDNNYQFYTNYTVQGIQAVAGLSYKF